MKRLRKIFKKKPGIIINNSIFLREYFRILQRMIDNEKHPWMANSYERAFEEIDIKLRRDFITRPFLKQSKNEDLE